MSDAFKKEQDRLRHVLTYVDTEQQTLEKLKRYTGSDLTEQVLEDLREKRRHGLKLTSVEPYFARLDFQEENHPTTNALYIGKVGLDDGNGDPLIIDWRAPVASLFYSFAGGDELAEYIAPEGLIEGIVHLKRNLVIRQRQLQRVVDAYIKGETDLSSVDEFLLYRLSERKSDKLRDIVSTIQSEQNAIIRAPRNTALIIQGVAGSGKTTIALHRLAYLMYEHQDSIRPERMIVLAPNRLFLDYIANVLPELGVGGIQQTTFNDWALNLLEDVITLHEPDVVDGPLISQSYNHFKGSLSFRNQLQQILESFEKNVIPDTPLKLWDGVEVAAETIRGWFEYDYRSYPLKKRVERIETRFKTWLEGEIKTIEERNTQKELKQKANQRIRSYLKKWPSLSPLTFYKNIMKDVTVVPKSIADPTLKRLKNGEVMPEDLPPMIMIHNYFNGIDKDQRFHHVVVDEAQDFSPFHIVILKDMARNDSFTILGDLSQAIRQESGIESWDDFKEVFPDEKIRYFQLTKSYRSTVEIIEFANLILSSGYQPLCLAEPVFRSGTEVEVGAVNSNEVNAKLVNTIKTLQNNGHINIGVIARTSKKCEEIYKVVCEAGFSPSLLSGKQDKYDGGLSVLPVTLSKGLEFEAAIIADATKDAYPKDAHHARLLYVGCTRALHELKVFYTGEPSPLLPL